jgi:cyclopropane fatty-acyl-phospholipid synthase-like methyltransferase
VNEFVRDGYDQIAERYAAQRDAFESLPYLERFRELLPKGGRVLDLGCGAGLPTAAYLTDHGFTVLGLDISSRMIDLARKNAPGADFEVRDMLSLRPGEFAFDAVVALYSIFHVGREEHARLLHVLRSFLPEGGVVLVTMGAVEWEGTDPDFHGAAMFWSHYGPARNRAIFEAAGFAIELDEIDTSGGEQHQVLIGRALLHERPEGA